MYPIVSFIYSIIIRTMHMIFQSLSKPPISSTEAIISTIKIKKEELKNIDIDEINEKINHIKMKVEENEIKLMDFEKNMKLADLEIKKYEYEYKIVEIKGNIITECATILKKIISIIDKESL
jgi:hypothetical protein